MDEDLVSNEDLTAEETANTLTIVGVKGWAILAMFLIITGLSFAWSFVGNIPLVVTGRTVFIQDGMHSRLYAFFPLYEGQKIERGMEARINLDNVEMQRYGLLEGQVSEVFLFPISLEDSILNPIPSTSLKAYLIEGGSPKILVIIEPQKKATPSGFKWSSKIGPPETLESGLTGVVEVILKRIQPIKFLFEND